MNANKLSLLTREHVLDMFQVWSVSAGDFSYLHAPWLGSIKSIGSCFSGHPALGYTKDMLLSKAYVEKSTFRRTNAISKFRLREQANFAINRAAPWTTFSRTRAVQRRVAMLLGPLNPSVLGAIIDRVYLGPGVNVGSKWHDETRRVRSLTTTRELLPFAEQLLNESGLSRLVLDADGPVSLINTVFCVTDARLTTVDKAADTDRTITVEPVLNSLLQNGIGSYLRDRLRSKRYHDLQDQMHNQRLATYPNATIDLSDASNSLSTSVVRRLVPRDWFRLFDLARSHRYTYQGSTEDFELFAGMGNGFCFALETIIFSAICYVASDSEHPLAVYGDDIIVRHEHARFVIGLLQEYGFKVNDKKSHISLEDPIRESCGRHHYLSERIPVAFLRLTADNDVAHAIISIHNTLYDITSKVRSKAMIEFLRSLRRIVPTVGSSVPNGPGEYFHVRKYKPKVNAIVVRPKGLVYRGMHGYNLAVYHKIHRGASSERATKERFFNRDSHLISKLRQIKIRRPLGPEPNPVVF